MNKDLKDTNIGEESVNVLILFLKNKTMGSLLAIISALEILKLYNFISSFFFEATLISSYTKSFTKVTILLYAGYLLTLSSKEFKLRNIYLGISTTLMLLNITTLYFELRISILIAVSTISLVSLMYSYSFIDKEMLHLEKKVMAILGIDKI